jgi:hypothetical protein
MPKQQNPPDHQKGLIEPIAPEPVRRFGLGYVSGATPMRANYSTSSLLGRAAKGDISNEVNRAHFQRGLTCHPVYVDIYPQWI